METYARARWIAWLLAVALSSCGHPTGSRSTVCADGVDGPDEECDDGNVVDGDGCTSACFVEPGFVCVGSPSVCTAPAGCPSGADETEPNDAVATANFGSATVTDPLIGRLCPGDVDYWFIDLQPGETVLVDVLWNLDDGDLNVTLVDSTGAVLAYLDSPCGWVEFCYWSEFGETIYAIVFDDVGSMPPPPCSGAAWRHPGPTGIGYSIW